MKDVSATGEASKTQKRGEHPELLFFLFVCVIFAHLDPNLVQTLQNYIPHTYLKAQRVSCLRYVSK